MTKKDKRHPAEDHLSEAIKSLRENNGVPQVTALMNALGLLAGVIEVLRGDLLLRSLRDQRHNGVTIVRLCDNCGEEMEYDIDDQRCMTCQDMRGRK